MEGHFEKRMTGAFVIWLVLNGVGFALFRVSSADHGVTEDLILRSLGTLLAVLVFQAIVLGQKEAKQTAVLYFLFFSVQIGFGFVETFGLADHVGPLNAFYVGQYGNLVYLGVLSLLCSYLGVSIALQSAGFTKRISITAVVVVVLIGPVLLPYVQDPKYLYTVPDVTDFRIVDRTNTFLMAEGIETPSVEQIAGRVALSDWEGTRRLGELTGESTRARIAELLPFTKGENYVALLHRRFYRDHAWVSLVCLLTLLGFFSVNFIRNPPVAAHFEKIHCSLLIYCVFEFIHTTTLSNATTFQEMMVLDRAGKYLTAAVMVTFVVLFIQRLRFLTRVEGVFYEGKLAQSPSSISRWRDSVDEFVIRQFLSNNHLKRRLLVRRLEKKPRRYRESGEKGVDQEVEL